MLEIPGSPESPSHDPDKQVIDLRDEQDPEQAEALRGILASTSERHIVLVNMAMRDVVEGENPSHEQLSDIFDKDDSEKIVEDLRKNLPRLQQIDWEINEDSGFVFSNSNSIRMRDKKDDRSRIITYQLMGDNNIYRSVDGSVPTRIPPVELEELIKLSKRAQAVISLDRLPGSKQRSEELPIPELSVTAPHLIEKTNRLLGLDAENSSKESRHKALDYDDGENQFKVVLYVSPQASFPISSWGIEFISLDSDKTPEDDTVYRLVRHPANREFEMTKEASTVKGSREAASAAEAQMVLAMLDYVKSSQLPKSENEDPA